MIERHPIAFYAHGCYVTSMSKNGKDPSCSNDNHYLIDRCWQNKPGYLVDGHAAVSFLE